MSGMIDALLARRKRIQSDAHREKSRKNLEVKAVECESKVEGVVEVTQNSQGEDYLLNQIDEFRAKAQQLQSLLKVKEEKAAELQQLVKERESKATELELIVEERQARADGISRAVEMKIDDLIHQVNQKLGEVGTTVANEIATSREKEEAKLLEVQEQFTAELAKVKDELSEKVHNESVQNYRNVSDLVKNVEQRLDKMEEFDHSLIGLKKKSVVLIVVGVINTLGVAAMILMELGIIGF